MNKSPRQQMAAWQREMIAGANEIDLPALADQTVAHFMADPEFLQAWAADTLRPVAYTLATQIAAATRTPITAQDSGAAPTPVKERPWSLWLDRLEHVGDRYIRFRKMLNTDLLRWSEEHRERGMTSLHLAGLGEKLASKMPEGKTVEEVYTDEEIDRWARLLNVTYKVAIPLPKEVRTTSQEAAD